MERRLELQYLLEDILGKDSVYFQPPENIKLKYPCIIYERSAVKASFADNRPYTYKKRYSITVIDKNPDSDIPDKIAQLPMCSFDRRFVSDNLNHDVFILYF